MSGSRAAAFLMITVWIVGSLFLWGLAFFPTGSETPDWLNVARNVCFGAPENGLPDLAGWIVLILGPISFVIVGMIAWPQELTEAVKDLWWNRYGKFFATLVMVAVVVEARWVVNKVQSGLQYERFDYANSSEEDLPLFYPRTNKAAPDFTLVDQSGNPFRLADYNDKTVLLTFAFAHCQTVCPVLVRQALDVGSEFKDSVRVVILTLDPWRDTPKSLPFLAEKWELTEGSHILSGSVEDVLAVLEQFQVAYQRDEKTGDVIHPSLVYLIEQGERIAYAFNNASNRWLRQAIERIESERHAITGSR
ncbi:MAG: SCO family protein [Bdellovibrionaceae bacterium]|nr:SCO family protein [Pseudobdellovibrionaceae bacterium]